MKRLFLIRHAETASSSEDGSDRMRALTQKGQADAQALGADMMTHELIPDLVYCSPAKRTKQTLVGLTSSLQDLRIEEPEELYNGACGDLLALIQNTNKEIETLMIVAHNPGIYELAAMLAGDGSPALIGKLMRGYRPGSLSVIECSCETWGDIQPGKNVLANFLTPDDYN